MLGSRTETDRRGRMADCEYPLVIREIRLIFSSSPLSVRRALRSTMGGLAGLDLTVEECASVELVLAEVLNNVVEHAYRDGTEGLIEVRARHDRKGLYCQVMDEGAPMPHGRLPSGQDDWGPHPGRLVPEGGFGWFLIRELAQDLSYARLDSRNCLAFRLPVGHPILRS